MFVSAGERSRCPSPLALAAVPLGKLGEDEDIGHAAVFFASREAGCITREGLTRAVRRNEGTAGVECGETSRAARSCSRAARVPLTPPLSTHAGHGCAGGTCPSVSVILVHLELILGRRRGVSPLVLSATTCRRHESRVPASYISWKNQFFV